MMLDVIAVISLFGLFGLALLYIQGCDQLKGKKS
jgi:hypothetical protein